jgi:hypothetical protein
MERCPVCRARLPGGERACPRCGADLGLLLGIEAERERLEFSAVQRLSRGDPEGAGAAAEQALALQRTPLALALAGFAQHLSALHPAEPDDRTGESPAESPESMPGPMTEPGSF